MKEQELLFESGLAEERALQSLGRVTGQAWRIYPVLGDKSLKLGKGGAKRP